MMKNLLKVTVLLAAALTASGAAAQNYDNTGLTISRTAYAATQGMDYYPTSADGKTGYLLSMLNYGYANLFKYDGTALTEPLHFKLGSFNDNGTTYQNHCNLVSFGSKKWAEGDVLPLAYITRANTSSNDAWGVKRACYVERINPLDTTSKLVQVIGVDDFVRGNPQFMVDGDYLYLFGNTKGNGKAGNKHYIYKLRLPALPTDTTALPQVVKLTSEKDEVYHYTWESTYFGGANATIQGGCVKDSLMYLPWGNNSSGDPSIIYVWNLNKRQMQTEINLQGTATAKGTTKFRYELEDVSLSYPGRLLVQVHVSAQPGRLYWISTDYLPKLRQNDWCANARPVAKKGCPALPDGYYYLQVKHNTSSKPNWACVQTLQAKNHDLASKTDTVDKAVDKRVAGAVGELTLQLYRANKVYQDVPKDGQDPAFIFHLVPTADNADTYNIVNCGVTGKPYLQQYLQSDTWTVLNAVATLPDSTNWSQFQFAPGNFNDSWLVKAVGTGSGTKARIWRRGNASNGITTSTLREYNDNLNDFVWKPVSDPQIEAFAKYCEQVSICLGLPVGVDLDQVRQAKYGEFQTWLKALNVTYDAKADYATLLKQVLDKKAWATTDETGVTSVTASKAVRNVTYYNLAGQQSARPFAGANIEVTTYSDGSRAAVKAIK